MKRSLSLLLCIMVFSVSAQRVDRNSFHDIDMHVQNAGPLINHGLRDIVDSITASCHEQTCMVRAIYMWVVFNIRFDCNAFHHQRQANFSASSALINREAMGEGYANLFKTMCDIARIECVAITGYAKCFASSIGDVKQRDRHAWNAVRINNTWYMIDAAWGAGNTDYKRKEFKKDVTDLWFFTNMELFALSHFPDNKKWLFFPAVNKPMFSQAPIIKPGAVKFELYPEAQTRGKLRGTVGKVKEVVFRVPYPEMIQTIRLDLPGKDSTVAYYVSGNRLRLEIPLTDEGVYAIPMLVNNAPAFVFQAEVARKRKR